MKRMLLLKTLSIIAVLLAVGCAASPPVVPGAKGAAAAPAVVETAVIDNTQLYGGAADEVSPKGPEAAAAAPLDSDAFSVYRIGPGDVLAFRSFDDETLTGSVTVRFDGHVSLPLIPDLKIDNLTREEATTKIKEAYGAYYQDPSITLTIVEPRSKKITVLGDVSQPADYFYTRPMTLLDAIAGAGGLRVNMMPREGFIGAQAQLIKALLIRHIEGERQVYEYDLRGIREPGAHASDTPVLPGDIIYVPESLSLVYILGAVRASGVYPMTDGMTLLQLVSRAGGFDEITGRLQHVVVIRPKDPKTSQVVLVNAREIFKTGQDFPVEPGDTVYVPRKPLANLQAFIQQLTGSISPILSLYRQAYDAYYTRDLYEETFDDNGDRAYDLLSIQQGIRSLGGFTGATLK